MGAAHCTETDCRVHLTNVPRAVGDSAVRKRGRSKISDRDCKLSPNWLY